MRGGWGPRRSPSAMRTEEGASTVAEAVAAPPPTSLLVSCWSGPPLRGSQYQPQPCSLLPPRAAWLEVPGGAGGGFLALTSPGVPTHRTQTLTEPLSTPNPHRWGCGQALLSLNAEPGTPGKNLGAPGPPQGALPMGTLVFQGDGPNLSLLCCGFLNWKGGGQEASSLLGLSGKQMRHFWCSGERPAHAPGMCGWGPRGGAAQGGAVWGGELPRPFPWWAWVEARTDHGVPGTCLEPTPCFMGSYPPIAQVHSLRLSARPKPHSTARLRSPSRALAGSPQATPPSHSRWWPLSQDVTPRVISHSVASSECDLGSR